MIKLTLLYPPRELNPNSRTHFHKRAPIVRKAKQDAFYTAFPHRGKFQVMDRLRVTIHVYKNNKAHYDLDNLLANCKAYQDGIFEGLDLNDSIIDDTRCIRCASDKLNPRIEIQIEVI